MFNLNRIDHLIYAAPTLAEGMDAIERLLGIRPVLGGRHPHFGTHNALLSLGPSTYLEVVAPDPELQAPAGGRFLQESYGASSQLATWSLREENIEDMASKALNQGLDLGAGQAGSRQKPDGTLLS